MRAADLGLHTNGWPHPDSEVDLRTEPDSHGGSHPYANGHSDANADRLAHANRLALAG